MSDATRSTAAVPPARSRTSVFMLLALVLAITLQLLSGFAMMAAFTHWLLVTHVTVGCAAVLLTVAEWGWLLAAPAGRYRLEQFFAPHSGPAEWSEGAFLVVATITVAFGVVLATILYLGTSLPFGPFLLTHQALAVAVAALYLIHSAFAMRRSRRRRTKRTGHATN